MALARVVSFDGVDEDRIEEMKREMREGDQPEEVPATEVIVLHDPESNKSLAILFFETEDDYRRGDEMLNGRRRDSRTADLGGEVRPRDAHGAVAGSGARSARRRGLPKPTFGKYPISIA